MTVHEAPVGATVEWYTPPGLFLMLMRGCADPWFDLDPAAAPEGATFVPARAFYRREDDGLSRDWFGHVWLNPPYGRQGVRFVDRMIAHDDGLLLLPSRTETAVYQRALAAADAVCLLRDRLWFRRADGHTGRSSFGSTIFAFGSWAVARLVAADLGWVSPVTIEGADDEPLPTLPATDVAL